MESPDLSTLLVGMVLGALGLALLVTNAYQDSFHLPGMRHERRGLLPTRYAFALLVLGIACAVWSFRGFSLIPAP